VRTEERLHSNIRIDPFFPGESGAVLRSVPANERVRWGVSLRDSGGDRLRTDRKGCQGPSEVYAAVHAHEPGSCAVEVVAFDQVDSRDDAVTGH
jgi:hypothetical protein